MNDNLSPHQFTPEQVGALRANDFPGSIGDQAARSRFRQSALQGDTVRPSHQRAGDPLAHLDQFTEKVRQDGKITEPIDVVEHDWGDHYSIKDGHHRALAAQAAGLPLPYRVVGTRNS